MARGGPEDAEAGHGVGQDVADDVGGLGGEDPHRIGWRGIQGPEPQRPIQPAVGQTGIGRGQLQQVHLRVAHHQSQAVVLRAPLRMVDEVAGGVRVS